MTDLTISVLEAIRKNREINMGTMSVCCGGKNGCWSTAVNQGMMSDQFKRNALKVFQYYDEHGIVPLPDELEMEEIGPNPKS